MKIRDYNQMMGYLTRPSKSTDPTQVKIDLEKTLNKYEDGPDLKSDLVVEDKVLKHKRAEGYYRRNAALGNVDGAFKNLVAANKANAAAKEDKIKELILRIPTEF